MSDNHNYEDIIHLPHPVSKRHPQMSMEQRAAQFSPFAALTGYEASVKEEARLTEPLTDLGCDTVAELNRRMAIIREHLQERPMVTITYFAPDKRKSGGHYLSATSRIIKMDDYEGTIFLDNGQQIAIPQILAIESGVWGES